MIQGNEMSAFRAIIPAELHSLQQRKEQGDASFRDITELIRGAQEGLHVHGLLARKRLEHVEDTIFPVRKRLGEIIMPWDKPHAQISEIRDDLGNLLQAVRQWKKEDAPHRSEGLSFYAAYAATSVGLLESRPTLAKDRGRGEYEELATECRQLKEVNARLARRLSDAVTDQDMLRTALTARKNGQLRMTESYEGIVRHVGRDDVVVLFEVDDDLVEHTYTRDQFVDSRMPEEGDRLAVYVHVAQLPPEESAEGADETTEGIDELRRRRRNILRGDEEF